MFPFTDCRGENNNSEFGRAIISYIIKGMKKVSYYLIILVILGGIPVSIWIYQKYLKKDVQPPLLFKVERGNIEEIVKARGEVVAQKEFNLELPFGGIVQEIFVKEGDAVRTDDPLIKLEATDFELENGKLEALLAQNEANLEKLIAGPTREDIAVSETKVVNAEVSLNDAKLNLIDKIQDAYTKSDDAVRSKTNQLFTTPFTTGYKLNFGIADYQLMLNVQNDRQNLEGVLASWKSSLGDFSVSSSLKTFSDAAKINLNKIKSYLDEAAQAVNGATAGAALSQTTIDSWKTDVSAGRTNVGTAIVNLTAAEEKLKTAESSLSLAQNELDLKMAGTRIEDIEIARAQIEETSNQIASVEEKIRKSTLYAPSSAEVVKIFLERKEVFKPGQTAITLFAPGYKIQSDISELMIGKLKEGEKGNDVSIQFDAFPEKIFTGRVAYVEPQEIVKDEDKYYRVNIYFEAGGEKIRSGMSADLLIKTASKNNVLKIPEIAVYERSGKKFVTVLDGTAEREVEIKTGISDGESVEITGGLSEWQTIAVSTK